MARGDQERWDERYRDGDWVDSEQPSPIVSDALPWLQTPGRVLDAACGAGRNSLFLARAGHRVISVDISWLGLQLLAERARREHLPIHPVHADLGSFPIPAASFDIIINTKFLLRDLFPAYVTALRPGGLLIFETYNVDELDVLGGDMRREFVLERNELKEAFASSLDLLLYEEGVFERPEGERGLARMIASFTPRHSRPSSAGPPPP